MLNGELLLHFCQFLWCLYVKEMLETDTNSLCFAQTEGKLCDCTRSQMKGEWLTRRISHCKDEFVRNAYSVYISVLAERNKRNITSSNLVFAEEIFVARNCCVGAARRALMILIHPFLI